MQEKNHSKRIYSVDPMHNSEIFRNCESENQVYHETAENGT
jgi:hypothetical protein